MDCVIYCFVIKNAYHHKDKKLQYNSNYEVLNSYFSTFVLLTLLYH